MIACKLDLGLIISSFINFSLVYAYDIRFGSSNIFLKFLLISHWSYTINIPWRYEKFIGSFTCSVGPFSYACFYLGIHVASSWVELLGFSLCGYGFRFLHYLFGEKFGLLFFGTFFLLLGWFRYVFLWRHFRYFNIITGCSRLLIFYVYIPNIGFINEFSSKSNFNTGSVLTVVVWWTSLMRT